jgi:hypothetical protein
MRDVTRREDGGRGGPERTAGVFTGNGGAGCPGDGGAGSETSAAETGNMISPSRSPRTTSAAVIGTSEVWAIACVNDGRDHDEHDERSGRGKRRDCRLLAELPMVRVPASQRAFRCRVSVVDGGLTTARDRSNLTKLFSWTAWRAVCSSSSRSRCRVRLQPRPSRRSRAVGARPGRASLRGVGRRPRPATRRGAGSRRRGGRSPRVACS